MSTAEDLKTFCDCPDKSLGVHWKIVHILTGSPAMNWDVTANNHLLPLAGESWEITPIRAARMKIWFRLESSPVFDSLNCVEFWAWHFRGQSVVTLKSWHKGLGLPYHSKDGKSLLVSRLVGHWMGAIHNISLGRPS